jgi:DNA-binding CsgD family transcriptional regulator
MAPAELAHAAGTLVVGGAGSFAFLWLFRSLDRGPLGGADSARVGKLVPHLRQALALQLRLRQVENSLELLTAAFDHVALGAIIVDPEGRPLLVNKVAARIAGANNGFGLTADGLHCVTPADSRRLRELIRAVATEGERTGSVGLRMPRRGEGRAFELILVPLVGERPTSSAAAVVFVTDPERFHLTPEGLLRDLYGMTIAEERLALRLALGETLSEAADHLGIARNTAHCQLDSIFVKTDTHSQTELVRLLHRGPVATRPYEDSARHKPVEME